MISSLARIIPFIYGLTLSRFQDSGAVFDCRVRLPSLNPYFLEYDRVKEMLDHALITKQFTDSIK